MLRLVRLERGSAKDSIIGKQSKPKIVVSWPVVFRGERGFFRSFFDESKYLYGVCDIINESTNNFESQCG